MSHTCKRDPRMRRVGRGKPAAYLCAAESCDEPLNEVTVKNDDPFCSAKCAHEYHGVEIQLPGRGYTVGSSS